MAAGAILGLLAITACAQTSAQSVPHDPRIDTTLAGKAETACLRYRGRAEREPDEFADFMAQSCTNVLADISHPEEMNDARVDLAVIYLEALVELEQQTNDMMKRRRTSRAYPLRPNRIGEFLMAHHLGVIDSYGYWRHAYLRANPA
jgi:hypothetical protein